MYIHKSNFEQSKAKVKLNQYTMVDNSPGLAVLGLLL